MRALICGDIHGNLPALEKILKTEKGNWDLFISHGDVVNYAPWSNECVDCLETLNHSIKLVGNHEENYISGVYPGQNIVAKTFFEFCYPLFDRLPEIKKYQKSYELADFKIQHTIDNLYIYPDSDIETIMKNKHDNYIIGHSHHQFEFHTKSGKALYNTGSVGQNRKDLNTINYIIYDTETAKVNLCALAYDATVIIKELKNRLYPEICIAYYQSKLK